MSSRKVQFSILFGAAILAAIMYFARILPEVWETDLVGFVPRLKMAADILTPIAVLVGLALAWKHTETAGQLPERFTQRVEQLGSEQRSIRTTAIYALERIAKESKDDHGTIAELLSAFIRDWREREEPGETKPRRNLPEDVRAALTVLTQASNRGSGLHQHPRDLSGVDFSQLDLPGTLLQGLSLEDADLRGTNLAAVSLQGATLDGANLERADLRGAKNLTQDQINGAHGDAKTVLPGHLTHPDHWK